jgi:hypothetical protein
VQPSDSSLCKGIVDVIVHRKRVATPNDPKLSDCGGRRSPCGKAAGAKVVGAWAVTPGAAR